MAKKATASQETTSDTGEEVAKVKKQPAKAKVPAKTAEAKKSKPKKVKAEETPAPSPLAQSDLLKFSDTDKDGVALDFDLIRKTYRHTIEGGRDYMIVGFTWLQAQAGWGILLMERYVNQPVPIAIAYSELTAKYEDDTPKYVAVE